MSDKIPQPSKTSQERYQRQAKTIRENLLKRRQQKMSREEAQSPINILTDKPDNKN